MRIAFAGNPNSGKTTMYNALTGRNERVGNWAGVTVDKKEARIKARYAGKNELVAIDLPGAYSMSPFTSEESVTSEFIRNESIDVIVNIVDATNLSRSLFFTTQLLELGIPIVIALNKTDSTKRKETEIDTELLSRKLLCPVVSTVSTSKAGLAELVSTAMDQYGNSQKAPYVGKNVTDRESAEADDKCRFEFVNELVSKAEYRKVFTREMNAQDRIDSFITHPIAGLPIFAGIMFLVFQISQAWLGPFIADVCGGWIDAFKEWASGALDGGNDFLVALLTEGIIGGVSAVVGFLPLVMVMYFMIALLEDCGYMARATVVLDPIFKKVGLSGKSVIPFVIGTGCAIPGVMACRTIKNERERNAAAMLTPFMPCGAKLPVIALFAGAFFPEASWVGTLMYFMGIAIIFLGALIINAVTGNKARGSYFIIELPEYKTPSVKRAALSMLSRGWAYIVKAGTVILLCNAAVYIMQSFDWSFNFVAEGMENTSILASVAEPISVILIPIIGARAWQMAAAAVTGFIAKENVVGTLAVCYGISNLIDTEALEMAEGAGTEVAAVFGLTKAAALAYLAFNLFTPPCFAAIGAMNSEIKNKKWLLGGIAFQLAVGFSVGFIIYQAGTFITTGKLGAGFIGGLIAVIAFAAVLIFLCVNADRKLKAEYTSKGNK